MAGMWLAPPRKEKLNIDSEALRGVRGKQHARLGRKLNLLGKSIDALH